MMRKVGVSCKMVFPQFWESKCEIYFQMEYYENPRKDFK